MESFETNGLNTLIPDVQANNPWLVDLPLIKVFQVVVRNLADNNLMVILDNHLSKPGWCCSNKDGNGFFRDEFFNPENWIKGLTNMARMFKGAPYSVVALSLRNELRGPRQDVNDWYIYYRRSGIIGCNETFGLLTSNWDVNEDLTKIGFMQKLSAIQTTYQGPKTSKEHQIIFHPMTGLCVRTNSLQDPHLTLDQCSNKSDFWSYNTDAKTLTITKEDGIILTLQAEGINKPAELKSTLSSSTSQWHTNSNSMLHLSTKLNNSIICLDVQRDSQNITIITTNACKCLNNDKTCDPTSQWFKLVTIMDIN